MASSQTNSLQSVARNSLVPLAVFGLLALLAGPAVGNEDASASDEANDRQGETATSSDEMTSDDSSAGERPQKELKQVLAYSTISQYGYMMLALGAGGYVAGIFHLKFDLYESQNASDSVWSQQRYVAVTDGTYSVPLGKERPLPKSLLDRSSYIGITLVGEGEILRDQLRIRSPTPDDRSAPQRANVDSETKNLLEEARQNNDLAFADVAERALEADQAEVAQKLGSLTVEDIRELAQSDERAMNRLGKHIADPNAHQNQTGGGLGEEKRVMRTVGGSGGNDYRVDCPDGHVVTGIKGGAGNMVDRITIICTALE